MSRFTTRGRDPWSHNGREHGFGLPLDTGAPAWRAILWRAAIVLAGAIFIAWTGIP